MSEQQLEELQPIHITDGEITIDEMGRVVINNPDLAKAIAKQRADPQFKSDDDIGTRDRDVNFSVFCGGFDWKCKKK